MAKSQPAGELHPVGIAASIDLVYPSPTNTRRRFDETQLLQLAESIRQAGLLSPILVRPMVSPVREGLSAYEIVAGERRWRAAKLAELAHVPVIVREMNDAQVLEAQIVENSQRADVHPLEEADAFARILATGVYGEGGTGAAAIAEKIGRPVEYVAGRLELAKLAPTAREKFEAGRFTLGHARILANIAESDQAEALKDLTVRDEYLDGKYQSVEKEIPLFSVGAFRQHCLKRARELKAAPFDKEDPTLSPRGACSGCPMRTGVVTLFGVEKDKGDACLDRACWDLKEETMVLRDVESLRRIHGNGLLILDGGSLSAPKSLKKATKSYWNFTLSPEPKDGYAPAYHIGKGLVYARADRDEAAQAERAEQERRREEASKREKAVRATSAIEISKLLDVLHDETPLLRIILRDTLKRCYGDPEKLAKKHFGMKAKDEWNLEAWTRENLLKLAAVLTIYRDGGGYLYNTPYPEQVDTKQVAIAYAIDFEGIRKLAKKALPPNKKAEATSTDVEEVEEAVAA